MAKKVNRSANEIDLTTFAWVNAGENPEKGTPGCGGCHPGGGGMEYDRDGRRYDRRAAANPSLSATLDGDYYRSRWAESGVIEADCFICHLPGYDYKARLRQLSRQNFQWAVIAGSGIGHVDGSVRENTPPRITYNRRLFNEDGQIVLDLMSMPASENCLFCHGRADLIKRGFSWNDWENHDVHNMHGVDCVCCHRGGPDHNLTKGNENLSTVRDDLDDTMLDCGECHTKGYIGAPLPVHRKIRPNHLEKLSCRTCHIPRLNRAAAQGLCVSSGKVINYPKAGATALGDARDWKPDYYKDADGRLEPVNRFQANLYTNLEADGIYYPLFAREMGAAYARVKSSLGDDQPAPLVRTRRQIKIMLVALGETLAENRRFQQVRPAYHYEGRRYFLDRKGRLASEADHTWVAEEKGFNISHNIAPTRLALGANGCDDCHAHSAHMFESWIAGSAGASGGGGSPVATAALRLNPLESYLKELHEHNHLKWIVGPMGFLFIFLVALGLSGERGRVVTEFARSLDAAASLVAPLRQGALGALAFTGYLFFYNNIALLDLIFRSMTVAVRFHLGAGIVFVLCSLPDMVAARRRWRRLETILLVVLAASGALICCRERFGFELKYGIAVVHASSALVFLSLQAANWYRRVMLHKLQQRKLTPHCNH